MSNNGHHNGFRAMPPPGVVPLIGQPIEIWGWFPTVSFGCRCRVPERPPVPVLIAGMDSVVKCPLCGAHYRIGAINMDASKGVGEVSIARVTPTNQPPAEAPETPAGP